MATWEMVKWKRFGAVDINMAIWSYVSYDIFVQHLKVDIKFIIGGGSLELDVRSKLEI